MTDEVVRRVVSALFKFQNNDYWKLWLQLLGDIAAITKNKGYKVEIDQDKLRIIHWIVMTVVWRSSLADQNKSMDRIDLNSEATKILSVVDPEALSTAIDFWASERGGKLLLERKQDKAERYSFNPEYTGAFVAYINHAIAIRPRWREEFLRALNSVV